MKSRTSAKSPLSTKTPKASLELLTPTIENIDPFDLPEWLGEGEVIWVADGGVRASHLVPGRLISALSTSTHQVAEQPCDLLAVDEAYPAPVADDATRLRAHQAWQHGQVLLVSYSGRLALAVPGNRFTADGALDALDRLARAVGAQPENYSATLNVGSSTRRT
jgi:hypothetical protein